MPFLMREWVLFYGGRVAFLDNGGISHEMGGPLFIWERITSEHETKDRTFWGQTVSGRTEQFTSIRVDNIYKINCSKLPNKITCHFTSIS